MIKGKKIIDVLKDGNNERIKETGEDRKGGKDRKEEGENKWKKGRKEWKKGGKWREEKKSGNKESERVVRKKIGKKTKTLENNKTQCH